MNYCKFKKNTTFTTKIYLSMVTAVIIDDEVNSREYLFNLIKRNFENEIHVFGTASSVPEGIIMINTFQPQLVFLDVEMPEENGLRLFDFFTERSFEVVFTTAHLHYAISAIKNNAFDYLLKPIDKVDLITVIKRFERKLKNEKLNSVPVYIPSTMQALPKIPLPTLYGVKYIEPYTFLFAKAAGSYSEINTIDGKTILLSKSLKEFESMTTHFNFFRSHKSYILNLEYVSEYVKKDEYYIILKNNHRIPLSMRKKDEFMNRISQSFHPDSNL